MRFTTSLRAAAGLVAKAGGSALVIGVVASRTDLSGVRASLATASVSALALAFAPFLLIPLLGGLRWWMVLRGLGQPCRLGATTMLFSAAAVAGQVLPSVAGDGLRVWLATRRGCGAQAALHSVLLERVFMVIALLVLALATAPLLAARTGTACPIWLCAAVLAIAVLGLAVLMTADRLDSRLNHWAALRPLIAAAAPTRALLASRWGAQAAAVSLASNLNFALAALLLARALGLPVSALDCLAIMPTVTLAATLPVSLGGWGVREGVLVVLLGHVGVAPGNALALSLLFGAFAALAGLPGLLVWSATGSRRRGSRMVATR